MKKVIFSFIVLAILLSGGVAAGAFQGPKPGQAPGTGFGFFSVDALGNVGVGTSTPAERFQVDGNIRASGEFLGTFLGWLPAANVIGPAVFGSDFAASAYAFPAGIAVGTADLAKAPARGVFVNGDFLALNPASGRGRIGTGSTGAAKLWTLNADFNEPGAVFSAGMESPTTGDELKLKSVGNWLNSLWGYRRPMTIDNAKIDANLTDFPVLVKLTASNFDFTKAKPGGEDIRFTAGDGTTLLNYEVESWDSTSTLEAYIWVKIPSVADLTNTVFYMYYGNPAASSVQNPTGVWDSNFVMVQHLEEKITSSTVNIFDSTANANHGTHVNYLDDGLGGKIDGGDWFYNLNTASVPDSASLDSLTSNITVEAWVWPDAPQANDRITEKWASNMGWNFRYYYINSSKNGLAVGLDDSSCIGQVTNASDGMNNYAWAHVAFSFDLSDTPGSNQIKMYINGVRKGAQFGTCNVIDQNNNPLGIGYYVVGNGAFLNGGLDELRISKTTRSIAWIKASYESSNNTLLTYGNEENVSYSSGGQTWESGIFNAGSEIEITRLTANWQLDGTDNIPPKFQILGSNDNFIAESVVFPGPAAYYEDTGGVYDINSGEPRDVSAEVLNPYRYWKTKVFLDTGANLSDTPKVFDVKISEKEKPLVLQPTGGNVGIGTTSTPARLTVAGAVKLADEGGKPVCDAARRGLIWLDFAGAGTADTAEICVYSGSGYIWSQIFQ